MYFFKAQNMGGGREFDKSVGWIKYHSFPPEKKILNLETTAVEYNL